MPGSAVSAVLVRGDLSMAGTCTVTYVDATHLLACGHPITQFGPVSMPMTKADVVATLASPLNAFKIVNTTETVGSFTEDRASAIMGRFGSARMIPVTVEVRGWGRLRDCGHAKLTGRDGCDPASSARDALRGAEQPRADADDDAGLGLPEPAADQQRRGEMSFRLSGELTLQGEPTVHWRGSWRRARATSAAINTALYINERFGSLYANEAGAAAGDRDAPDHGDGSGAEHGDARTARG